MTIQIKADFPHFGAWLNQLAQPQPTQNSWPTWRAGGEPFTAFKLRVARRHLGIVSTADPSVSLYNPYPNYVSRHDGWTPPPAPAASPAYWLLEPPANGNQQYLRIDYVDDTSGTPTTIATPDPSLVYAMGHVGDIRNFLGVPKPISPFILTDGGFHIFDALPLVKVPTGGLSTARQSAQCAYLVELNTPSGVSETSDVRAPFTWDGANWTADLYYHDWMDIEGGWLYAVTIEPTTGSLDAAHVIPECRRRGGILGGAGPYPKFHAIHWPNALRAFSALNYQDTKCRIIWRYVPAWKYMSVPWTGDLSAVNSTNGYIPSYFDAGCFYRGVDMVYENPYIDSTMNGSPSGAWRILAESSFGTGFDPVWTSMTLIDPPSPGDAIIFMGGYYYEDPSNPSSHYWVPAGEFDLWPEASAIPFPLPVLGGGAIVGGTS